MIYAGKYWLTNLKMRTIAYLVGVTICIVYFIKFSSGLLSLVCLQFLKYDDSKMLQLVAVDGMTLCRWTDLFPSACKPKCFDSVELDSVKMPSSQNVWWLKVMRLLPLAEVALALQPLLSRNCVQRSKNHLPQDDFECCCLLLMLLPQSCYEMIRNVVVMETRRRCCSCCGRTDGYGGYLWYGYRFW